MKAFLYFRSKAQQLEILLILIYTSVFLAVIYFWKFFRAEGLSFKLVSGIFILKILFGILYGYIHLNYYWGGDTYKYFRESKIIFDALPEHPLHYLELTLGLNGFGPPPEYLKPYTDPMGFWGDTGSYMMVRFNALARLFSLGHYNVHVVFINFLSLIGLVSIYKWFRVFSTEDMKLIISIFFIPSILFWISGLHKEPLVIFGLGAGLWNLHLFLKYKKAKNLILSILALLIAILVRKYLLAVVLPNVIALIWCYYKPKLPAVKFISVNLLFFLIMANFHHLVPAVNFLELLHSRHYEFLVARSEFYAEIKGLEPTFLSVVKNAPKAFLNVAFRPQVFETFAFLQALTAIEVTLFTILMVLLLPFNHFKTFHFAPVWWFCIFFCIAYFVLVGLTVSNFGAIARYKSVALPFLFPLLILLFNFKKFRPNTLKK